MENMKWKKTAARKWNDGSTTLYFLYMSFGLYKVSKAWSSYPHFSLILSAVFLSWKRNSWFNEDDNFKINLILDVKVNVAFTYDKKVKVCIF